MERREASRKPYWNGDSLRSEMTAAHRVAEQYRQELLSGIRRGDPRANEGAHDEALGESYFARLISNSSLCDSPERLLEFLGSLKVGNIQFLGAFDVRVARAAFRKQMQRLGQRAESAIA